MENRRKEYASILARQGRFDSEMMRSIREGEKAPLIKKKPEITQAFRVLEVSKDCHYYEYWKYLVGKVMTRTEEGELTFYSFVDIEDQHALNRAANWSKDKNKYALFKPRTKKVFISCTKK